MTYINPSRSAVSSVNSTTTALNNGQTFTGTAERTGHPDMVVQCYTDQSGLLYVDFSTNGTNWDSTITYNVAATTNEFHRLVKGFRYVRVRFTNDSGSNQTYIRLATYYGTFGPITTGRSAAIQADHDTLAVRPTNFWLDQAQGRFTGESSIRKFGYNGAVGTNPEIVAALSVTSAAFLGFMTAATTVRVKAGNVADDAAGAGAQQIIVEGLDSNFAAVSETLTTAGTSASSNSSNSFIRVNRAYVGNVGTYHGANTGNVVIEKSAGSADLIQIDAGLGQSQMAVYTIPAGKTGYLSEVYWAVEGAKPVTLRLFQNQNADDVSTPFTGKRLILNLPALEGVGDFLYETLVPLPAKTDVWLEAVVGTTTSSIAAGFEIILVTN